MILDRAAERLVRNALAKRDIDVGGARPWDIQVHDPAWYRRVALDPSLQLGESYMDGQWDCAAVDELFFRIVTFGQTAGPYDRGWRFWARNTWARLVNPQSRARAGIVAEQHYDQAPELFRRMLDDETMSYTCGYWRQGDALGDAQHNKLRMICEKLALKEGDTLLDIGCGFGGLAEYAASNYGARVVGITNSEMHHRMARERCHGARHVELLRMDYREIPKLGRRFDKVASIEMIEAVGPKNFAGYMDIVRQTLTPNGRLLIQAFISETSQHVCNAWFHRYIFPNGVSPSLAQLERAAAGKFSTPAVEDIGLHYPPTLLAWSSNFRAHWGELSRRFDERFRRMWEFYLLSLTGVFRARDLQLCQITYQRTPAS